MNFRAGSCWGLAQIPRFPPLPVRRPAWARERCKRPCERQPIAKFPAPVSGAFGPNFPLNHSAVRSVGVVSDCSVGSKAQLYFDRRTSTRDSVGLADLDHAPGIGAQRQAVRITRFRIFVGFLLCRQHETRDKVGGRASTQRATLEGNEWSARGAKQATGDRRQVTAPAVFLRSMNRAQLQLLLRTRYLPYLAHPPKMRGCSPAGPSKWCKCCKWLTRCAAAHCAVQPSGTKPRGSGGVPVGWARVLDIHWSMLRRPSHALSH